MKLIINADDFGLTKGTNAAIVEAMKSGLVTTTTLMVNQLGTDDAIDLIKTYGLTNVGLHVNLTSGKPASNPADIPDLVDNNGQFLSRADLTDNSMSISPQQVYLEAMNQYKLAVSKGVDICHVDSHHFSAFLPNIRQGYIRFANELGLPSRRPEYYDEKIDDLNVITTDQFSSKFYAGRANEKGFKQTVLELLEQNPNGYVEIMAHPAYYDSELDSVSSYTAQRELELQVLTSKNLAEWLNENDIQLITFNELARKNHEEY